MKDTLNTLFEILENTPDENKNNLRKMILEYLNLTEETIKSKILNKDFMSYLCSLSDMKSDGFCYWGPNYRQGEVSVNDIIFNKFEFIAACCYEKLHNNWEDECEENNCDDDGWCMISAPDDEEEEFDQILFWNDFMKNNLENVIEWHIDNSDIYFEDDDGFSYIIKTFIDCVKDVNLCFCDDNYFCHEPNPGKMLIEELEAILNELKQSHT